MIVAPVFDGKYVLEVAEAAILMAVGTGHVHTSRTGVYNIQAATSRSGKNTPTFQADVDVSNLKQITKSYSCLPAKNKSASSMIMAFTQLLSGIKPMMLQTDKRL